MTANELLVWLGRAWSRLLIYPGGLAAFGIVWLWVLIEFRNQKSEVRRREEQESRRSADGKLRDQDKERSIRLPPFVFGHVTAGDLSMLVMPWLGLALLPLPLAPILSRQTDSIVVLALLEWPRLLLLTRELHADEAAIRAAGARRLAAALNSYPTLILAILLFAQSSGSLDIIALVRWPGELVSSSAAWLHWLGALAFALVLPTMLGVGPFAARAPAEAPIAQVALHLRALGLLALAALPVAGDQAGVLPLLRMLAALGLLAALLRLFAWLTTRAIGSESNETTKAPRHQEEKTMVSWCLGGKESSHSDTNLNFAARRWAQAYLLLDALLLLALLWGAAVALQSRLA